MRLYYQDNLDDAQVWQGIWLTVKTSQKPRLQLNSAQGRRARLSAGNQTLFWAQIADGYYDVNLYRTLPKSADVNLLTHITSLEIEQRRNLPKEQKLKSWAKHYIEALQNNPLTCLYDGLWSMHYQTHNKRNVLPYFAPSIEQDSTFYKHHYVSVNWGFNGSDRIINLFAVPENLEEHGRIKWWRKIWREGQMPPILLWFISYLDAFVILDGHDRLQAALLEGGVPDCFVLSSYTEQAHTCNAERQAALLRQISIYEERMANKIEINPSAWAGLQSALIEAFDNRSHRHYISRSWATLTVEQWDEEVATFNRSWPTQNWYFLD